MTGPRVEIARRQFIRHSLFVGAAVAVAPGILAGCGATSSNSSSTLENAKKQGYITAGFANEPPYAYADSAGNLTGEAPAVARAVMKRLGIKEVEGVLTSFSSLIPGLVAGRFGMIAAGQYITPERCGQIAFGDPDFTGTETIAVAVGNPLGIKTYRDIANNPRINVAAERGAQQPVWAMKNGVPKSRISLYPDDATAIAALLSGRVQAFMLQTPTLEYQLKHGGYLGKFELVAPFIPTINGAPQVTVGGCGFRKSDTQLVQAYNKQLHELQKSGELGKLVEPFGFDKLSVKEASRRTAREVCKA